MFKFSNIKKLFSYNWSTTIKNAVPKGNKSLMQDSAFKDIMNGAIVRILAVVFSKIAAVGIAVYTVVKAYSFVYGDEIMNYAVSVAITDSIGTWILEIISASIIPILILVFINIMKKKEQNAWPYFILLIISLLQTLYSFYECFGWFAGFLINPIFAIIGIVSVLLVLLGNIHIAVGCVDFCLKSTSEYSTNTTGNYQPQSNPSGNAFVNGGYQPNVTQPTVNNYQPQSGDYNNANVQNIPQQNSQVVNQVPINNNNTVQNTIPDTKYCNMCGSQVDGTTVFCPQCGNKM